MVMKIQPKYIQIIGDAVIPLLGFFFWNWNLYFILLYYFLDLVLKEVLLHVKSAKVKQYQHSLAQVPQSQKHLLYGCASIILLGTVIYLVHIYFNKVNNAFDPIHEIYLFWSYKDMGVEQGYILLPLIILMGIMQYKTEFVLPKTFTRIGLPELWKPHLKALVTCMAFAAMLLGLTKFTLFPETILVLGLIGISSLYQFLQMKK